MKICQGVSFLLTIFLLGTISFNPAYAHRFYVALVIPFSNAVADQGRQYRQGFMLATTERDSHPDEESDGHLGGLDVYVSVIDSQGDIRTEMERIVSQGRIDIVVAIGSEKTLSLSFGNVVPESLAQGTEVMVSEQVPLARYVEERKFGTVVSAATIEAWCTALNTWAANPSKFDGERAARAVRRDFDLETVGRDCLEQLGAIATRLGS